MALERRSVAFIVNFEHISHLVLVTLNMYLPAGYKISLSNHSHTSFNLLYKLIMAMILEMSTGYCFKLVSLTET